jgi:hypothetical protein
VNAAAVPPVPAPLVPVLVEVSEDPPDTEYCPDCGRCVAAHDRYCPGCGAALEVLVELSPHRETGPGLRRDCEPHRAALLHLLGITSLILGVPALCGGVCLPLNAAAPIAIALGAAAWVMARNDLARMRRREMDRTGRASTEIARGYALAGACLGGLGLGLTLVLRWVVYLMGGWLWF